MRLKIHLSSRLAPARRAVPRAPASIHRGRPRTKRFVAGYGPARPAIGERQLRNIFAEVYQGALIMAPLELRKCEFPVAAAGRGKTRKERRL
ncbi:MAG: hypothetical protein O6829_11490 [Alphaproteobacteria bacterium]|nr:hypothetical protein [Alphaproteobacteria bacterium]